MRPNSKITFHKKGLLEWLKVKAFSLGPSTGKQKQKQKQRRQV
jgi:hypothetical protein